MRRRSARSLAREREVAVPVQQAPLILASASPRRRQLLASLGLAFEVHPCPTEERRREGEAPTVTVARLAREKLVAALPIAPPDTFVLAADTLVVRDGEVLGKPTDEADAAAMLRALGGRSHEVMTAVALGRAARVLEVETTVTEVWFRPVSEAQARAYAAIGEGADKAGGYAIQGIAAGFVTRIEGSYSGVVGLPLAQTLALLGRHGALRSWP